MKRVFGVLLLFVAMVGTSFGQAGTGSVAGTITDPSKAVVPKAVVTLNNSSTGLKRTQTKDASGNYRFTAVPEGT